MSEDDPDTDPLERVRRLMNHNLVAPHEDLKMLGRLGGEDAAVKAARHRSQEGAIAGTGRHFGLAFTRSKKGFTACYLGDKPPAAMGLIDKCATRTVGVGATYQQLLSSVALGQLHRLSRFLMRAPAPAEPGNQVITRMDLSARNAALHLMAGPLCVSTLGESLRWFFGWDTEALDPDVTAMLHTWGRIANVPYPGPGLSEFLGH